MDITEPMTMATDYALGALAIALGLRLWRDAYRRPHSAKRPWALAFFSLAASALLGGTHHGLDENWSAQVAAGTWYLTLVSIGLVSAFLFVSASRILFSQPIARTFTGIAAVQFVVYAGWVWQRPEFIWAVLDYAPTMLYVLAVSVAGCVRGQAFGKWAVAGVLVTFGAAAIQQSDLALHKHFNHNDLYHVVQMMGTYLLYRAGLLLDR